MPLFYAVSGFSLKAATGLSQVRIIAMSHACDMGACGSVSAMHCSGAFLQAADLLQQSHCSCLAKAIRLMHTFASCKHMHTTSHVHKHLHAFKPFRQEHMPICACVHTKRCVHPHTQRPPLPPAHRHTGMRTRTHAHMCAQAHAHKNDLQLAMLAPNPCTLFSTPAHFTGCYCRWLTHQHAIQPQHAPPLGPWPPLG